MNIGDIIIRIDKQDKTFISSEKINRVSFNKQGIWVLFGCKSKDASYVCLNVGKSVSMGSEILYDISCLNNIDIDLHAERPYINQFGEYCGFEWNTGETQECLYPYLASKYTSLVFLYAYGESNYDIEKSIATFYHALYWRNGKAYETPKSQTLEEGLIFDNIEDISESIIKQAKRDWKE